MFSKLAKLRAEERLNHRQVVVRDERRALEFTLRAVCSFAERSLQKRR